jgi:nitroreductase
VDLIPEIANRRSIRKFADTPIDRATLDRILEAGRSAPSAKNRQTWRFVAITERETRLRIQDAAYGQDYVGEAPAVIALCTTNIDYTMPNGQLSYPIDLGIAGAFMMIQAQHEGLGSCAVTTFQEADLKAILTVPHKMRVVMLLLVGTPAEDPEPSRRFPLDRIVGREHW